MKNKIIGSLSIISAICLLLGYVWLIRGLAEVIFLLGVIGIASVIAFLLVFGIVKLAAKES